jgi:hypothetical protein
VFVRAADRLDSGQWRVLEEALAIVRDRKPAEGGGSDRWAHFTADELGELRAGLERGTVCSVCMAEDLWQELQRAIHARTGKWPDDDGRSLGFRNIVAFGTEKRV